MAYEKVSVSTRDGTCPVHVFTDDTATPSPAIVFYMDAGGIRPAVSDMAQRLANAGYVVLLPDLFIATVRMGLSIPWKYSRAMCERSSGR